MTVSRPVGGVLSQAVSGPRGCTPRGVQPDEQHYRSKQILYRGIPGLVERTCNCSLHTYAILCSVAERLKLSVAGMRAARR